MEKQKGILDKIKGFFKFIDPFGESFSFKYKTEDIYSTVFGGIITLIFSVISLIYFIYNFIPFINRENFTLQFYTMNLNEAKEIKLKDSLTNFAIGLDCPVDNNTNLTADDLFDLNASFVNKTKNYNDTIDKNINNISMHYCKEKDFYNKHNEAFKYLNISQLQCLDEDDKGNFTLKGIYTDRSFSYYEFTVRSKYKNNETHFKIIDEYLIEKDSTIQILL